MTGSENSFRGHPFLPCDLARFLSLTGNYVIHVFSLLLASRKLGVVFPFNNSNFISVCIGEGVSSPGLCSRSSDASVADWLRALLSAAQRMGGSFAGVGI